MMMQALGCVAIHTAERMSPQGAVLSADDIAKFETVRPAEIAYTAGPRIPAPVIPLQIFGIYYSVDVVLISEHPDWDMHEYARLDTPDGAVWMAKAADRQLVQTVVAVQARSEKVVRGVVT